ncbi:hypothetical protein NL54_12855 [Pantoea stewartii]|nr:hypothetical protein NL54_12855 [Pantoea stewartii]KHN58588.1 hypothetical protein OI73_21780 [Pantoea stewartii]
MNVAVRKACFGQRHFKQTEQEKTKAPDNRDDNRQCRVFSPENAVNLFMPAAEQCCRHLFALLTGRRIAAKFTMTGMLNSRHASL